MVCRDNSTVLRVSSGVPRCVLTPMLFLICVNDLVDVVPQHVSIRLFAATVFYSKKYPSTTDQNVLQKALMAIDN